MLEKLAVDVVILILRFLKFNEMIRISRVCKSWYDLSKEPALYNQLTFNGISKNSKMKGDEIFNLIELRLKNVKYISILDFTEIMSDKILEYHLRLMLVKCPFNSNLIELRVGEIKNDKTLLCISKYCLKLKILDVLNLDVESNSFNRIAACKHLEVLKVEHKGEKRQPLDDSLRILSNSSILETISLNNCHISTTSIKQFLKNSRKIKNLHFLNCGITEEFVNEIVANAKTLEYLSICYSPKVNFLPLELFSLRKLQHLNFSNNEIDTIPNDIIKMESLKTLILNGNKLRQIPDHLCSLESLEELQMNDNDIIKISKSIIKLHNLKRLEVKNNKKLSEIPEELDEMRHVKFIYTGTKLEEIRNSIQYKFNNFTKKIFHF